MGWWMTGIVRRIGNHAAVENARVAVESRRYELQQVDALVRHLAVDERSRGRAGRRVA